MTSTDIKTIQLIVNSEDARKKLDDLKKRLTILKQKRDEALNKGDSKGLQIYTKEISKIEREIRRVESRAETMGKALKNLDKSSPNQLKQTLRELQRELNSGKVQRGSKEWHTLTRAIKETKTAIKQVNTEMAVITHKSWSDRFADWGNKWYGITTNVMYAVQAYSALRQKLFDIAGAYADMYEAEANVMKYTKMTREEVEELNESLKAMDTRASREELNNLVGQAGKLGIKGKEALLEFTDAADKIQVALGADLGKDAILQVGKLAMTFGEDKTKGLRGAMLATGSALNEMQLNSAASAGYVAEFTARLAGVGKQAKITQADIMGYAAVLDSAMLRDEMSSTALSQFIMKMFQDPARFANIAGIEVKKFADLMKQDANEAMLLFLNTMRSRGGFEDIAPMFKDMHLNGQRAASVLSALADKTDQIAKMQNIANEAYRKGTSVIELFNINNNTVQAKMEKARKKIQEVKIELGEKLLPVAMHFMSVTSLIIRSLNTTINFIIKNREEIKIAVVAVTLYTAAYYSHIIAAKLSAAAHVLHNKVMAVGNALMGVGRTMLLGLQLAWERVVWQTRGATAAQQAFNKSLKANPWGFAASVIAIAVTALISWVHHMKSAQAEQRKLRKETEDGATSIKQMEAQIAREANEVERLRNAINKENMESRVRQTLIHQFNSKYGKYLNNLLSEKATVEQVAAAYEKVVKNLRAKIILQMKEQDMHNMVDNRVSWEAQRLVDFAEKAKWISPQMSASWLKSVVEDSYTPGMNINNLISTVKFRLLTKGQEYGYGPTRMVNKHDSVPNILWKPMEDAAIAYVRQFVSTRHYMQEVEKKWKPYQSDLDAYLAEGALGSDFSVSGGGGSTSTSSTTKSESGKHGNGGKEDKEDPIKAARERIEAEALAQRVAAEAKYNAGLLSRQQYEEELYKIENDSIVKQQALYAQGSKEWNELELKGYELDKKQRKTQNDWSIADIERQEQVELDQAKQRHIDGLYDEEQYQEELDRIKLKYLDRRATYQEETRSEDASAARQRYHDEDYRQQLARREKFLQLAKKMQEEYFKKTLDEQEQDELALLKKLVEEGVIATEQEEKYKEEIRKKYEKLRKDAADKEAEDAKKLKKENDEKKGKLEAPLKNGGNQLDEWSSTFITMMQNLNSLQQKLKDGEASWKDYAAVATASLGLISAMASSFSNLYAAEQQKQETAIEKKYDKELEKAGNNQKKRKKIEEQKEKELAKIKNKYNNKAMAMEMAQAIASTAMAAINAYASAAQIPFIGWKVAPIAAALALAAGAIQIATIKKQHDAETSGYYSGGFVSKRGGFTNGTSYKKEAGIVHEGEFVANHEAVNNPQLLPILRLIDYAQKNNTVARLTAEDVSRTLPGSALSVHYGTSTLPRSFAKEVANVPAIASAPQTHVQIIDSSSEQTAAALQRLNDRLEQPIETYVTIDGPNGLHHQYSKYQKMLNRK